MIRWEIEQCKAEQNMEEKILVIQDNTNIDLALKQIKSSGRVGLVGVDLDGKITGACKLNELNSLSPEALLIKVLKPVKLLHNNNSLEEILFYWLKSPETIMVVMDIENKPVGIICAEDLLGKLMKRMEMLATYFQAVVDTVDEAITIIDKEGVVLVWNQKAEELYRTTAKEILGKNIESFFRSEDIMVTQVMKKNLKVCNTYHQPREGTHILINSNPITTNNNVIGSICADRNITELVGLYHDMCSFNSPVKIVEEDQRYKKKDPFRRILGRSRQLKKVICQSRKVASTDAPVLIRGETGTGKELFAEAIHYSSDRKDAQLICINCGAIPPSLFESELFGYEGGAFTGADRKGKPGQFEIADGGTIFLDEVGEIPLQMQVKLLRVLQNKMYYRIGGTKSIKVDVRIISATNRDLEEMIEQGKFRNDLFYRLNVFSIEVPPLREHREDIPEIVQCLLGEFSKQHKRIIKKINSDVLSRFLTYSWPGNFRELRNVLERMVILTENGEVVAESLPSILLSNNVEDDKKYSFLKDITEQNERDLIINALEDTGFNIAQTTKILGIPRSTLYYKMKVLGISKPQ